ncbi:MAG TPA: zinc ribbon domain-containing protein [Desulfobacterales bacterium]|nr:zinc ribbon domain-containing protein [Desulfobacterales bacterium]
MALWGHRKRLLPCHIFGINTAIIVDERTTPMPIFEFRCSKCNEVFEILSMGTEDEAEMKCPHCGSEDFERVLSTTSYSMGFAKGESRGPSVESRQCASGTCTSWNLPGHSKN